MANEMLLVVRTAACRYVVRRDDVAEIRMIDDIAALEAAAPPACPVFGVELGPLLLPGDRSQLVRWRGLFVPLRRRYVAMVVDYVETFLERVECAPLPALLRERLRVPWATGALVLGDELVLQLDLRAIARSVLIERSGQKTA